MSFPLDLQQLFLRDSVVAVLTAPDGETAEAACRALSRGGLSCAEITFRTEAAAEAIARAAQIDGFVVGAAQYSRSSRRALLTKRARRSRSLQGPTTRSSVRAPSSSRPSFPALPRQPRSTLRFVPTGGIDSTSLSAYLALPSVLACGGSWLVEGRLLAERRFDEVERLAREAAELVR